jgi:magnesium transporter
LSSITPVAQLTPTPRLTSENLHDPVLPYVNPNVVAVRRDDSVEQARQSVRAQTASTDAVNYLYVVDDERVLVGVVPVRALLLADADSRVGDLMIADVIAIPSWATVLVACEYFVNRPLLAFPVIEDSGRLVGAVDVSLFTDEMLRIARQSFDDIFQLAGIRAVHEGGTWSGFLNRFPWLLCNIAGGVLAALLAGHFESLLDTAIVLALFIPVVLALSESISIQAVTLTIQSLHTDAFRWRVFLRSARREASTALLLGLACGTAMTGIAAAWKGQPIIALALGAAIAASMTTSAVIGLALPTLLHAFRANPRIAAGPIVLASADTVTLLFYFTLAGWVLR